MADEILKHSGEENFHYVYEKFRKKVYKYTFSICHSAHLAEEATQEVFIQIWLHRETLAFVDNMDGFVFTIAFRKTLNLLRKAAYDARLLNELQNSMPPPYFNKEDERMMEAEYKEIFQQALSKLSPQRRLVFQLSRQDGLNYREIAEQLKLSPNTVKNHMIEALRVIRDYLKTNNVSPVLFILFAIS